MAGLRIPTRDLETATAYVQRLLPDLEITEFASHDWVGDPYARQTWPMLRPGTRDDARTRGGQPASLTSRPPPAPGASPRPPTATIGAAYGLTESPNPPWAASFFFKDTATTEIFTASAQPGSPGQPPKTAGSQSSTAKSSAGPRPPDSAYDQHTHPRARKRGHGGAPRLRLSAPRTQMRRAARLMHTRCARRRASHRKTADQDHGRRHINGTPRRM